MTATEIDRFVMHGKANEKLNEIPVVLEYSLLHSNEASESESVPTGRLEIIYMLKYSVV